MDNWGTGVAGISVLGDLDIIAVSARREASEEDDEHSEEQEDHSRKAGPHADAVDSVAAGAVLVDVVLDDAEHGEVDGHDDESHEPGDARHGGGEKSAAHARAGGEEECEECKSACYGVENHHACKTLGRGCGGVVEVTAVDVLHDLSGVIADVAASAVVISREFRGQDAVAKGSEGNGGVVGERHLQYVEVVDDWGGDGGDEEQDCRCKEQEGAHMVEHAGSGHFDDGVSDSTLS